MSDTTMTSLPEEFADLQPFADWALATEAERYSKRLGSSMEHLQAFYDAGMPRLDEAASYLSTFEWPNLPDDATRLLHVMYSLINISFCIEAWRQPRVPDSGASNMDEVIEPF
jgi:hypothetical protein